MDWRISATACCALTLATAPASAVIDVVGSDRTSFGWAPASGPVASYSVYVSKNGSEQTLYSVVSGRTEEIIRADYGDSVIVQVAAADATGQEGPRSGPSPEVRFLPAAEPPQLPVDRPARSDFDGDGVSELWLPDPVSGRPMLWSLEGDAFTLAGQLPKLSESWEMVAIVDYDGDADSDVLWRDSLTGRLDLWLIDKAGLVGAGMIRGPDGVDWIVAASDDFDGDGRADILMRNPTSGELEVWLMDGTTIVEVRSFTDGPKGDYDVASSGDYDGSGRADLLWHAPTLGTLEAWLSDDSLGFEELVLDPALDARWEISGSADFGGDGQDEFLLRNRDQGMLEVHGLDGPVLTLPSPDPSWEVAALGDYDGDGASDVLWRTEQERSYTAWLVSPAGDVTPWTLADPFGVADDDGSSSCPGDLDGDGVVGLPDFMAMRRCFGRSASDGCSAADLDRDGLVGWRDFSTFRSLFNAPCSGP